MSAHGKVFIVDCQVAGIAGDMFLGSLIDLGADVFKVTEAIKSLEDFIECKGLEVEVKDVMRGGLRAKKVNVKAMETRRMRGGELLEAVERCLNSLNLTVEARGFALNTFNTLLSVEARLHGESVESLHLHEAGEIDMPAEIVGSAVALEDLDIFKSKVYSTPVAVGGGLLRFSHGVVSSPAPATLEILKTKGFPMKGGPIESELSTPTGVALLVNLIEEVTSFYPAIKPLKVGYGAGTKDFKEVPNVLRVVLGEAVKYSLFKDEIVVLETNVDDVTGEVIGYTIEKLLEAGARDVSVIPMLTKKNRPGQILKVITDRESLERLSRLLIEESGSLGVRWYPCERYILARESVQFNLSINGYSEPVKVKVARDMEGKIVQIKPEYEDAKRVAEKTNKPLRKVMHIIEDQARNKVSEEHYEYSDR
ncbi:nickel pincer cofactor biosynthesis protein LarC [Candidatus Bathyarchaeota archaeon]|nr:nickel pincer cofactor biosynthesis protein LarC [Candidatus Bathyarchaeota archaeon]